MRIVFLATLAGVALGSSAVLALAGKSSLDRQQVQDIVQDYILENPEVIVQSLEKYRTQVVAKGQEKEETLLKKFWPDLRAGDGDMVLGNPEGRYELVVFADHRCGYCRRLWPVLKRLVNDVPDMRLVMKEYPILGEDSQLASQMALAGLMQAPKQEDAKALYDVLQSYDGDYEHDVLLQYLAHEQGFSVDKLAADSQGQVVSDKIRANLELGRALDIRGTPTLVTQDAIIRGALGYEDLKAVIMGQAETVE